MKEQKFYRALIRFVMKQDKMFFICIPAWSSSIHIGLDESTIPDEIKNFINFKDKIRVYAYVNLSEEDPKKIELNNWELPA